GFSGETAACAARRNLRESRGKQDNESHGPGDCGNKPGSSALGSTETVQGGSLLPFERAHHSTAAAAGPKNRHPAADRILHRAGIPRNENELDRHGDPATL